jgi:hypothetical protein
MKYLKRTRNLLRIAAALGLAPFLLTASSASAQSPPDLGDASSFAIVGGYSVTAALSGTVIFGDVGVSPGVIIINIPGGGTVLAPYGIHGNDTEAIAATASATDLFASLAGMGGSTPLGVDLSGLTLTPGTYSCAATSAIAAAATLTLDGPGVYVFQIGTTLTTGLGSEVLLVNGATSDQVFWQCGTTATIGGRLFSGNLVTGTTITVGLSSDVNGRLLAPFGGGTVTMAGFNVINGVDAPEPIQVLGDAETFAVLAGSTVTAALTGTVINGDVGVTPGVTLTGFPLSATVLPPYGTHANDAEAIAARESAVVLIATVLGTGDATVLASEMGGTTLTPGTYSTLTTATMAAGATLTLDGPGIYLFQIGSTMTAAAGSNVVLINGATANQVFWSCGTTATISSDMFIGTVFAGTTAVLANGSDLNGRLFAINVGGTVTLAGNNTIDIPDPLDDGTIGNNYCGPGAANSTGMSGEMSASGSNIAADDDLTIIGSQLPDGQLAYIVGSRTQGFVANPGGSTGNLCVLGYFARFNRAGEFNITAGGAFSLLVPLTDIPEPLGSVAVMAGETWNFQCWHRDTVSGTSTSNFTDGIEILFN